MTWVKGRMLCFDLETTAPQPELARIVQYGLAWVGGGEPTETHSSIVNPGDDVEIPDEAAEVHGITTERARAEGVPASEALEFILEHLALAASRRVPAVAFNAPYDFTVTDRETLRHDPGAGPMLVALWARIRVVDPRPIDSILDKYRRSYPYGHTPETAKEAGIVSSRTLGGMCAVYGVELGQAHDAAADAIAAGRLAYVMGARGEVKRSRRDAEGQWARRAWAQARNDLDRLHDLQAGYVAEDRPRFAEYKRGEAVKLEAVGDAEGAAASTAMAERLDLERGWPVLEVMPHETEATT